MIPALNYVAPKSTPEALELLAQSDKNVRVLAGGTDVITGIQMNSRRFQDIDVVLDINHIPALKEIRHSEEGLTIGGAVTFTALIDDAMANKHVPLLTKAAATVGNLQIRNRGTLSGNFVNNAPCADSVPPLLVYNARVKIESHRGSRTMLLQDFLTGTYKTQIEKDELVTEIFIPHEPKRLKGDFYKLGRRKSVAISRISLAVLLQTEAGLFTEMRIATGAVTAFGERFYDLEKWAIGKSTSQDNIKHLASETARIITANGGLRWSSPYKIPVLQQALYQLIKTLV